MKFSFVTNEKKVEEKCMKEMDKIRCELFQQKNRKDFESMLFRMDQKQIDQINSMNWIDDSKWGI